MSYLNYLKAYITTVILHTLRSYNMDLFDKAALAFISLTALTIAGAAAAVGFRCHQAKTALTNMENELDVLEVEFKKDQITRARAEAKIDLIIDRYQMEYLASTLDDKNEAKAFFERHRVGRKKLLGNIY